MCLQSRRRILAGWQEHVSQQTRNEPVICMKRIREDGPDVLAVAPPHPGRSVRVMPTQQKHMGQTFEEKHIKESL